MTSRVIFAWGKNSKMGTSQHTQVLSSEILVDIKITKFYVDEVPGEFK
jgi:hypothetical protein